MVSHRNPDDNTHSARVGLCCSAHNTPQLPPTTTTPLSDHPHPSSSAVNERRSNWSDGEVAGIVFPQVTPFISPHSRISLHQGGAKIDGLHHKRLHTITLKQLVYSQLLHGHHIYPYSIVLKVLKMQDCLTWGNNGKAHNTRYFSP